MLDDEPGSAQSFAVWKAWALLAGIFLMLALGVTLYTKFTSVDVVPLQVAGSAGTANEVVGRRVHDFKVALGWDFVLIVAYTSAFAAACWLGLKVFWTHLLRRAAGVGLALAVGAGVLNAGQDVVLLIAVRDPAKAANWLFRIAQGLSFAKFSALLVASIVGVFASSTALGRLVLRSHVRRAFEPFVGYNKGDPTLIAAPPPERPTPIELTLVRKGAGNSATSHWEEDWKVPPGRPPAQIGICVSGGGVRSASVTLGALQSLRQCGQLARARYLVSVSGGGYMAGAFQLALKTSDDGTQATLAKPSDVLDPGSGEEDHVRRHSSYLSDGPRQWLTALGVLFRNLMASFFVIALFVATLGIAVGWFYRVTHIAELHALRPLFLLHQPKPPKPRLKPPGFPIPTAGVTALIVTAAVLTAVAYLVRAFWVSWTGRGSSRLNKLVGATAGVTALFGTFGAALPALVWMSAWLTWHTGFQTTPGTVASTGTVTVLLSYFGTLAATLWRKRKKLAGGASGTLSFFSKKLTTQVVPNSMVQMLIIWVSLILIFLVLLVTSGWVASSGADRSPWAFAPLAAFGLLAFFLDQTAMSLHPFYRSRLATAFAVRRAERNGQVVALPYDYETEGTPLSKYAKRVEPEHHVGNPAPAQEDNVERFPQVIFAASANLTGQEPTPPGRRTVSFTLASDYVGGPQIGWARTDKLEKVVSPSLRRDLTVQAAVAVSGAAFASAMGAQTRFYEVFLALSNARLGAWLPNPGFLDIKTHRIEDWMTPGLPRLRRLSYFAREILGVHPRTSRLLFCTDGGHYENLGLVELLRHRCRLIYCIDASGDTPPLATTLAQATTLAYEELGVVIELHDPFKLVPGAADPIEPESPLSALNARLSADVVCIGDITYPDPVRYPDEDGGYVSEKGTLILAKSNITPQVPYELLSFALEDSAFPRDGTADQWFNAAQFDAYQGLGRFLGRKACEAAREAKAIDGNGRPLAPRSSGGANEG